MGNFNKGKKDLPESGHISESNIFCNQIDGKKSKSELCGQDYTCVLTKDELLPGLTFFGVYDGHGEKGKIAAELARDELQNLIKEDKVFIKKMKKKTEVESYFNSNFNIIQETFKKRRTDFLGSGSCAICILIIESKIYSINLGDSRAILGIKKGDKKICMELSVDNKPNNPLEQKRINENGGDVIIKLGHPPRIVKKNDEHPGLAVSRTLGDILAHEECGVSCVPEIIEKELDADDQFIVIGSDGIWDLMNSIEVVGFVFDAIENGIPKNEIIKNLIKEARHRWELLNILKQKYQSEYRQYTEVRGSHTKKQYSNDLMDIDDISGIIYFIELINKD